MSFAFTREALAGIQIPLQIWRSEQGGGCVGATSSENTAKSLPGKPDVHVVPVGHYDPGWQSLGLVFSSAAQAKGCIKGAIVGGIAGSVAGHGKIGAVAGCVRHEASKEDAEKANPQVPKPPKDGGKNLAVSGAITRSTSGRFRRQSQLAGCGLVIAYQRHHAGRLRHFRQRLENSVFGDLNVLERVVEQIAQQF